MERPKTYSYDQDTFVFKQRSGAVNWREIQNIDIDQLIHTGDIGKINGILENLTFASIDKSDLERYPDTFFLKLFRLSQFALEYLQDKQRKIDEENKEIILEKNIVSESAKQLEDQIKSHQKFADLLSREVTHKKKTLSTYEYLLKQPATMAYMNRAINKDKAVRCPKCSKFFESHEFFLKHHERRHVEKFEGQRPSTAPLANLEAIKSTLEEQVKVIQQHQEKEIFEFRSLIQSQLLELKNSKTTEFVLPSKTLDYSAQIEEQRKEIMQIRAKQRWQQETLRKKDEEIFRIEQENQRLLKAKEKMEKKMLSSKRSGNSKDTRSGQREEFFFSNGENTPNARAKLRSESGMTNFVHSVMNGLIEDKPNEFSLDHCKEIDLFNKHEAFAPYSERVSPSLMGLDSPQEYFLPLNNPKPQDIIEVAKVLGIDPVKETQYLYLAAEFLKAPIPKNWIVSKVEGTTVFKNKESGKTQENHPGVEYFKELFRLKRNRKDITFDKVKAIVRIPKNRYLEQKYTEGVIVFFIPDDTVFTTQRMMNSEKVQAALDKMKIISIQQLNKMDEETKKFSERGEDVVKASEMVNSELLTIFNKVKT